MRHDAPGADLGAELSSARARAGRSLRDVASASGISAAYLQKLERSQVSEPSPRILRNLAVCLGISYGRLMKAAGYEAPIHSQVDPLARKLAASRLTDAEERAVAAFIEHLVAQRTSPRRALSSARGKGASTLEG